MAALLPTAVGFLNRRRLTAPGRCLWVGALLGSLLFGALCEYGRIVWHNNLLFLRTQVWLEGTLFGAAYYYTFTGRRRRVVPWLLVAFTLGAVIETVWFMDWRVENGPYLHVAQAMLLVGLVITYFEQVLNDPQPESLLRTPMFVASVGVMLYYTGTVFVYVLEALLPSNPGLTRVIFILESTLRILALNGSLAAALWLSGRRPAPALADQGW